MRKEGETSTRQEQLDKAIIHPQILNWKPDICMRNHAFSSSDHCLITVELSDGMRIQAHPFKFERLDDEGGFQGYC